MAYAADKLMSIGAFVLIAARFLSGGPTRSCRPLRKRLPGYARLRTRTLPFRTVDIDGHYSADGGTFVFRFLYRAPNHYVGLSHRFALGDGLRRRG